MRRSARRTDLGVAARGPQRRAGRQVGCHIITMTHDLLKKLGGLGQGPRAVLAGDGADVPPRRGSRRASRCSDASGPASPAAPASSAAPGRPSQRRRASRSWSSTTSAPAGASSWPTLLDARGAASSRATCSTRPCSSDALRGLRLGLPPAANADVRHGLEHPRRDLEQNTIATANVLEAMRARGRDADRLLLDRLGLRRTRGLPDARGRAVPDPDLALRAPPRSPARACSRPTPRATASPADLPLRLDPRRALHPRPRLRLLPRAQRDPTTCGCSATAAGEVLPLRADCVAAC